MKIKEKNFGILSNGEEVKLYTLSAGDIKFSLINYGAAWTSLFVPSRKGIKDDVLLGYSDLNGFLNNMPYMGVTVGRFANRIKGAAFNLDGKIYRLDVNEGGNSLHSGRRGFDKLLWKSEAFEEGDGVYVRFELFSPDGDGGFPGNMNTVVTYGLTKSNEIIADYKATIDKPSPVNITNHAYFNLAGEGQGNILSHEVVLSSSSYVEVDAQSIATGKLLPVKGADGKDNAFNFLTQKRIDASGLDGYDHCFVVDGEIGKLRPCAEVTEPASGRVMKVLTTQPGVQFYTGNKLKDNPGKYGSLYQKQAGFCLETQHFPDTPNQNSFPSCIFGPQKDYQENAVFAFDVK